MKKSEPKSTPLWRFLFVAYAALMLWLLFDRPAVREPGVAYVELLQRNMNLIPLRTIGNYWKVVKRLEFTQLFYHCVRNLGGNIFLFIPIGYFLPRLWPTLRNFLFFFLTCALAIVLVELLQLVTLLGSLDIDDLILNLIGMTLGYLIFMTIKKQR